MVGFEESIYLSRINSFVSRFVLDRVLAIPTDLLVFGSVRGVWSFVVCNVCRELFPSFICSD